MTNGGFFGRHVFGKAVVWAAVIVIVAFITTIVAAVGSLTLIAAILVSGWAVIVNSGWLLLALTVITALCIAWVTFVYFSFLR